MLHGAGIFLPTLGPPKKYGPWIGRNLPAPWGTRLGMDLPACCGTDPGARPAAYGFFGYGSGRKTFDERSHRNTHEY